jgi:ABC-type nitrate/sulfonate/bicarbonate transport system substrate-binding protein
MKLKTVKLMTIALLILMLSSCKPGLSLDATEQGELIEVTLMLDWVPNTNHTGIFVAQAKGYFEEAGLLVNIVEPGEVYAEQAVSAGAADFGISFQEQITLARADDVPLVSIAAIIQNNTSGFASRAELGGSSPKDWEGLRYGSFGSPFEEPTLRVLMECAGGRFNELEVVDTGFADPLALLSEEQIDLAWIFYAWQGLQAELQGLELDLVMMADWFECIPDYYTPILITNETMIEEQPETVRAMLIALTRGYRFAIEDPAGAASILLEAVPELNTELVQASQAWISPRYQGDAARWGEQRVQVWQAYADWMLDNEIIREAFQADEAMTNEYLP